MKAITSFMEKYFVPLAARLGSMRVLIAIRDAFIGTMPAAMAGSVAVMINAIIRDLPTAFSDTYNGNEIPVIREIIGVNGYMWQGTLAVAGMIFAISWGYNLARTYQVDAIAGALVAFAALIMGVAFSVDTTTVMDVTLSTDAINAINAAGGVITADATGITAATGAWGWLPLSHLGAMSYFTTMILGGLAVAIYIILMKRNITIKLPESVPPAVAKAFTAIIPATIGLYVVATIYYIFNIVNPGVFIIDWVSEVIAQPLMQLGATAGAVATVTVLISVLWFFGLHGPNILAPVLEGVWGVGQLQNLNAFQQGGLQNVLANLNSTGTDQTFLWVRGSFDAYAWFGGSGGTITLIIAIFLLSKRADYRTVAKLGVGPGVFNINEPVMFGLPIVLNPIMFIPFVIAPLVATMIGYYATILGLVNPVTQSVTWVLPPFLLSFLATAGDWRAPIVTLISFAASFIIYAPFVIAANAQEQTDI